jgi:hypothetical protein
MWISWPVLLLAIAAIVGGVIGGGAFTIVLVPLAGIALVTALFAYIWARVTGTAGAGTTTKPIGRGANALPRSGGNRGAHAPTSPERLADLRREQQLTNR